MTTTNVNGDGNPKTIKELVCSAEITAGIHSQLTLFSVLTSFLAISAFLGNTLILVAFHKVSSLHSPSKLLYRTLATTDLCVGIITLPLRVTVLISAVNKRGNICHYAYYGTVTTSNILCGVSLSTLTAISVDRLLALLLRLRYQQIVTLKRTYLTVTIFWVLCIVSSIVQYLNNLILIWYHFIGICLCLIISSFCYTKIFLNLRRRQFRVCYQDYQEQPNQTLPLHIARYRKAVSSALWVQLALLVCYLPFSIIVFVTPRRGISPSVYIGKQFALTLVFLNSSLNPILYCWKMRAVRQAAKKIIGQYCCSSN